MNHKRNSAQGHIGQQSEMDHRETAVRRAAANAMHWLTLTAFVWTTQLTPITAFAQAQQPATRLSAQLVIAPQPATPAADAVKVPSAQQQVDIIKQRQRREAQLEAIRKNQQIQPQLPDQSMMYGNPNGSNDAGSPESRWSLKLQREERARANQQRAERARTNQQLAAQQQQQQQLQPQANTPKPSPTATKPLRGAIYLAPQPSIVLSTEPEAAHRAQLTPAKTDPRATTQPNLTPAPGQRTRTEIMMNDQRAMRLALERVARRSEQIAGFIAWRRNPTRDPKRLQAITAVDPKIDYSKPVLSKPIHIQTITDPATGQKVDVQIEGSARAQLEAFRPSRLWTTAAARRALQPADRFYEPYRQPLLTREGIAQAYASLPDQIARGRAYSRKMGRELIHEIPSEWLGWIVGIGAAYWLTDSPDPSMLKSFLEENVTPAMVPVFMAFIGAMHATEGAARWLGLSYDPDRAPKSYSNMLAQLEKSPITLTPGSTVVYESTDAAGNVVARRSEVVDSARQFQPPSMMNPDPQLGGRVADRVAIENTGRKLPFVKPTATREVIYDLKNPIRTVAAPATKVQKLFMPMIGPVGMSIGMFASMPISDFFSDPNTMTCMRYKMKLKRDSNGEPMTEESGLAACDIHYAEWVLSNKLDRWAPQTIAMFTFATMYAGTAGIGGILARSIGPKVSEVVKASLEKDGIKVVNTGTETNPRTVIEKMNPAASARGAQAPSRLANFKLKASLKFLDIGDILVAIRSTSVSRFTMITVHGAVFEVGLYFLGPVIEKWWKTGKEAGKIVWQIDNLQNELERLERNNWKWQPNRFIFKETAQLDPYTSMGQMQPLAEIDTEAVNSTQLTTSQLLAQLGTQLREWRKFLLQDTMISHDQWTQFANEFTVTYANAYGYYTVMLDQIRRHRHDDLGTCDPEDIVARRTANPNYTGPVLNCPNPFSGFRKGAGPDLDKHKMDELPVLATQEARRYISQLLSSQRSGRRQLTTVELQLLPVIDNLLRAGDPSIDFKTAFPDAYAAMIKKVSQRKGDNRPTFRHEQEERLLVLHQAVRMLRDVMSKHQLFTVKDQERLDRLNSFEKFQPTIDANNPFYSILTMLGNPTALEGGLAFHQALSQNPEVIMQDPAKLKLHPETIGKARIQTMGDYLLTSMVCGPIIKDLPPPEERFEAALEYLERITRRGTPSEKWLLLARANPALISILDAAQEHKLQQTLAALGWDKAEPHPENPVLLSVLRQAQIDATTPTTLGSRLFPFNRDFLIYEVPWLRSVMRPPRVVSSEVPADFCENPPITNRLGNGTFDIHETVFTINGKPYKGLVSVLRTFARPDIYGEVATPAQDDALAINRYNATEKFDLWWERYVDPTAVAVLNMLRTEYRKVIEKQMIPVLVRTGDDMIKKRGEHEFHKGVFGSMRQTLQIHFDLLESTLFKNSKYDPEFLKSNSQAIESIERADRAEFKALINLVFEKFRNLELATSNSHAVMAKAIAAETNFNAARDEYGVALFNLESFIKARELKLDYMEDVHTLIGSSMGPKIETEEENSVQVSGRLRNRRASATGSTAAVNSDDIDNSLNAVALKNLQILGIEMVEYYGYLKVLSMKKM